MMIENRLEVNGGQAVFRHNPFWGVQQLMQDPYFEDAQPKVTTGCIYDWSAAFFGLVADGMARLREVGHMKLEMIAGDGYTVMDRIRMGTIARDEAFPVKYDRIHASNVPDYV